MGGGGGLALTVQVVTDKGGVFSLLLLLHGQRHEALAERGQGVGELYGSHEFQEVRPENLPGRGEQRHSPGCGTEGREGEMPGERPFPDGENPRVPLASALLFRKGELGESEKRLGWE